MKLKAFVIGLVAIVATTSLLAQDPAREQKLQQAIDLLETKGDALRAMPLLEEVAKSSDRALAARGLLYLGQAQERQGNARARVTYERIVREFTNQEQVVAQARSRLAALAGSAAPVSSGMTSRLLHTLPPDAFVMSHVSPDGRYVTYGDAGHDLMLHDLVAGTARTVVTGTKDDWGEDGTFSKDGKQLAFSWYDHALGRYTLRVVSLSGNAAPRTLTDQSEIVWLMPHDWSPDGRQVAIQLERKGGIQEIALVSAQDGSRRALKTGQFDVDGMAFSGDGRFLAVGLRGTGWGPGDIYVLPVDGAAPIPVVVHRADDSLFGWSPDGSRILFSSDRGGATGLWAQPVERGAPKGAPALVKADFGQHGAGIDARGAIYTVVGSGAQRFDIKSGVLDFASGTWSSPPSDIVQEYSVTSNQSPDWSPDGKWLAYVTRRNSMRGDVGITIRSVPAGAAREIRPRLTMISVVRWTPDSRALLASGADFDGRSGIWRIDAATADMTLFEPVPRGLATSVAGASADGLKVYLRRVVNAGKELVLVERDLASNEERELFRGQNGAANSQTSADPELSVDRRKVYYRKLLPGDSKPPLTQVAFTERDLASGSEREIARGQLGGLNLSPDGRYFVTGSNDAASKTRSIVLIPVEGGPRRELFRVPFSDAYLTGADRSFPPVAVSLWAPDSSSILVAKAFGGTKPGELWWVPIHGNATPKMLDGAWRGGGLRVHPDGRRVVFQVNQTGPRQPAQIWVLENAVK